MRHADAFMNRAPLSPVGPEPPVIVTGPAAFDLWEQWLQSDQFGEMEWYHHYYHAVSVTLSRQSAARFLRQHSDAAPADRRGYVHDAIGWCNSLVGRLADSCDANAVRERFSDSKGRAELLQSVNEAEADDRRLAMCIESMC
jgi:hypothetical protein